MRTGSRLWADPRPIRGKPRSTPRGFRHSPASDKTATRDCNEGRGDVSRRPVPVMDRESLASHASDVRHPKTKISGPKWAIRNEPLDQSGLTKNIYWAQSGPYWTSNSRLPTSTAPIARIQLWGETAMKWSQAICASILVDEFYLLSLHARTNSRSGRDVPNVPLEPALRPNLFTADWGLPPRPVRTLPMRHEAPDEAGAYVLNLNFSE
jgi:hypothetical protein